MPENNVIKKFKLHTIFTPLTIVVFSCTFLIIINYLTIGILSASRAYVNGESHYSKAQKEATQHLITYLFTKDRTEWKLFQTEINVPLGDRNARLALINEGKIEDIKKGFRAGRNEEKDLDDLIWLFRHFHSFTFLEKAIKEWEKADSLIEELIVIGNQIDKKIKIDNLSSEDKKRILIQINTTTSQLTKNEKQFSKSLGEGTRSLKLYLLVINIFFTLIIISIVSIYYSRMLNKLKRSKIETDIKNKNLEIANKELDNFVYSASHDLRAPICSLKGLIEVIKLEDKTDQIKCYLNLMSETLNKQDQFIKDIIIYSRNKKRKINIRLVNLNEIIQEILLQNQCLKEKETITITKKLLIDEFNSDKLRLKIIFYNLVSNAIKYADKKKEHPFVSIKTYIEGKFYKIEIEDNGIGIKPENQSKIFEMFFVTNNVNKGPGLGLYITKEAVENLNGEITLESELNIGSKFTISIPMQYEN